MPYPSRPHSLAAMVINFAHSRDLGVPSDHGRKEWDRRAAALKALLEGGYLEPLTGTGMIWDARGRCSTYYRTALFEQTFRFRIPPRLIVTPSSLLVADEPMPIAHNRRKVNSIPALSTYTKLIDGVEITLSNGGQVFRKVVLYRVGGKRLYASGIYNYQNDLPKGERPYLPIIN